MNLGRTLSSGSSASSNSFTSSLERSSSVSTAPTSPVAFGPRSPQSDRAFPINSINIVRTSDFFQFVVPPPSLVDNSWEQNRPRDDVCVSGYVVINLEEARRVHSLKVTFLTQAILTWPDRASEHETLFQKTLTICEGGEEGMVIEAGPQMFEYLFILPPTMAACDRSTYGKITHTVEATLVGQLGVSPFASMLRSGSASSFSSGRSARSPSPMSLFTSGSSLLSKVSSLSLGGTSPSTPSLPSPLELQFSPSSVSSSSDVNPSSASGNAGNASVKWLAGEMSTSKPMWIVPVASENKEPIPLEYETNSLVDGLGIIPWGLNCNALTVGGYLRFNLGLENPNPKATVWAVRLYVIQNIGLTSPSRPEEGETMFAPQRMLLYEKGKLPRAPFARDIVRDIPLWDGSEVPGSPGAPSETLATEEWVRLPDENKLRPSTNPGTKTPMRTSHEFHLVIYFAIHGQDGNGKPVKGHGHLRKAILSQKVQIASCCCIKPSTVLPTYEEAAGSQSIKEYQLQDEDFDKCACGQKLSELIEREIARISDSRSREERDREDRGRTKDRSPSRR